MLKKKTKLLKKMSVMFLAITLYMSFFQSLTIVRAADEYDNLRAKWQTCLLGSLNNLTDPDIAAEVNNITSTANNNWTSMNTDPSRTYLWSDLADWTKSSTITNSYRRLEAMAIAYMTTSSSLQGNSALANDIINALDWMYANHYNASLTEIDNWWDWEIGAPQALNDIMVLMYNQLSSTQISNYISVIDKWCPNATTRVYNGAAETGANRSDKAQVLIVRGIVGKLDSKIADGRDALSQIFLYVTSGDGYYTDGSFIQHGDIAYTAGYGNVLLTDMARLLYELNGSSWTVTDSNVSNVFNWVTASYQSLIYNGGMMDIVHGRGISRQGEQEHAVGRSIIASIAFLAQSAPSDKAALFESIVKAWVQADTTFNNYYTDPAEGTTSAPLSVYQTELLKSIMNDSTIIPSSELVKTQVFADMDRVVQLRPDFGFGLSMFSSRTGSFEYGNGENVDGWWYGVGRTNLYNGDQNQYSNDNWATINRYRLPGTTTDGTGSGTPIQWHAYTNPNSWVGGSAVDGLYSTAGMQFSLTQDTGSPLQGNKSWFMLGDKMVALGAGITDTNNNNVETIVENRKLDANGDNALTVNGVAQPNNLGWSQTMTNVQWAHLAGSVAGSDIGYYFPGTATVNGLRESRTGSWSATNTGQSNTQYTNNYLSLALGHGVNPTGASYAYAVLPNKSAADMANYANNPDITILENTTGAQAVMDTSLNAVGANFWNDGTKTVSVNGTSFITSDKKASVTTLETPNQQIDVGVSDPTQQNAGTIDIEINRSANGIINSDPGITVTQLSPTIKMTINVNASAGKTFNARFNLASSTVPTAPTLTSATINDSKVTLSWPSVGGETGYNVKYGTTSGNYTNTIKVTNVSSINNYTVTGLTNGQTYYFAVSATNGAGESTNSNELSAVPNSVPNPHMSLADTDDAYVRDGTYANTNYGTATSMTVKKDNTGYNRYSLLKFDLSSITGTVQSAKIQLVPVTVGMTGINNQAYVVSNTWSESAITWNNMPALGTAVTSWTVPAVNTPVQIDVTNQVINALQNDKKLSICITGVTNQGSAATASYATKENGNVLFRPVIIIN